MTLSNTIDFAGLGQALLARSRDLLPQWFPNGRFDGHEFKVGSLAGEAGASLSINADTGAWADFATGQSGGDLTALIAARDSIKQHEAAKLLSADIGFSLPPVTTNGKAAAPGLKPPIGEEAPGMYHTKHGAPVAKYCYRDRAGEPLFYVGRYEPKATDGEIEKTFCWFTWDGKTWRMKAWPAPRPLYGLELLDRNPDAPIMIVEGEKACEAARLIASGIYIVMCWPGGIAARGKADWTPLEGRHVLCWPDADAPGIDGMTAIATDLTAIASEVKILDVSGQQAKWDAADALANGWTWDNFLEWAKPRASLIERPAAPVEPAIALDAEIVAVPNPPLAVAPAAPDESGLPKGNTYAEWERLGIIVTSNGSAVCNIDNAQRVMEGREEFKNLIWFDEFHKRYLTRFDFHTWHDADVREWGDIDTLNMASFMQRHLDLKRMGDDVIQKAAIVHAKRTIRNEPRDWMESLKWDGEQRLEGFFSAYMGAQASDYASAASANFWIGIAARIFRPGCQLDNMVVLEGAQGTFKTSALRVIGGPWYTGTNESVQSKDFFMTLHGRMIIEIPEMDAFSKADVTRIKQIITSTTDRFRPPYAKIAADHPRMSVFVGTTNESQYLKDTTGGRRFWPIKCGKIDLDRIKSDREQLFAEAVARFKRGDKWYVMPIDETAAAQEERRYHDAWEDEIAAFLLEKSNVTTTEVAYHLKIDTAHLGLVEQRRIASVMRILGWKKARANREGVMKNVWTNEELAF